MLFLVHQHDLADVWQLVRQLPGATNGLRRLPEWHPNPMRRTTALATDLTSTRPQLLTAKRDGCESVGGESRPQVSSSHLGGASLCKLQALVQEVEYTGC